MALPDVTSAKDPKKEERPIQGAPAALLPPADSRPQKEIPLAALITQLDHKEFVERQTASALLEREPHLRGKYLELLAGSTLSNEQRERLKSVISAQLPSERCYEALAPIGLSGLLRGFAREVRDVAGQGKADQVEALFETSERLRRCVPLFKQADALFRSRGMTLENVTDAEGPPRLRALQVIVDAALKSPDQSESVRLLNAFQLGTQTEVFHRSVSRAGSAAEWGAVPANVAVRAAWWGVAGADPEQLVQAAKERAAFDFLLRLQDIDHWASDKNPAVNDVRRQLGSDFRQAVSSRDIACVNDITRCADVIRAAESPEYAPHFGHMRGLSEVFVQLESVLNRRLLVHDASGSERIVSLLQKVSVAEGLSDKEGRETFDAAIKSKLGMPECKDLLSEEELSSVLGKRP